MQDWIAEIIVGGLVTALFTFLLFYIKGLKKCICDLGKDIQGINEKLNNHITKMTGMIERIDERTKGQEERLDRIEDALNSKKDG